MLLSCSSADIEHDFGYGKHLSLLSIGPCSLHVSCLPWTLLNPISSLLPPRTPASVVFAYTSGVLKAAREDNFSFPLHWHKGASVTASWGPSGRGQPRWEWIGLTPGFSAGTFWNLLPWATESQNSLFQVQNLSGGTVWISILSPVDSGTTRVPKGNPHGTVARGALPSLHPQPKPG